jgi:tetrahydromethanopterin S-methyltransferase subunit G
MAHIDFGQIAGSTPLTAREQQVQRTQGMLYATAIGSVIIVVVAALFLTLF